MLNQQTDLSLNDKGYLVNFEAWNKEFAVQKAREHGLELTDCHWMVIKFLRDYQVEFGTAPDPRVIIKQLGQQVSPTTPCTKKKLEGLFGEGGCKLACKIAGLPDCFCRGV